MTTLGNRRELVMALAGRSEAYPLADDLVSGEHEAAVLTATARAMDDLGIGHCALDGRWRYLSFNRTAEHMGQASASTVLGEVMWNRFPALAAGEFADHYRRAVDTGVQQSFQAYYPAPLDIWVEVVAVPRTHPRSAARSCVLELMFIDITAQRTSAQLAATAAAQQLALVDIAQALAAADDLSDVLAVLAGQGQDLLGANGCGLCLREEDGRHVNTVVTDSYADVRPVVQRTPADFPLPAIASAARGETFFLADRDATEVAFPGSSEVYRGAGVQASAAVPLRARGRLLGCLSVGFADVRTFSAGERDILHAFAALTAQALGRLDAMAAEHAAAALARTAADQQRALNQVASALVVAQTRADVLAVVGGQGRRMLGASGAGLALVDPTGAHVQILTDDYFTEQVQHDIARLPRDAQLPIVRAAVDGTPFFLSDRAAAEDAFPGCGPLYAAAGTEGSAEVPLVTGRGTVGTLSVAFAEPHAWPTEEQELLQAFAVLAGQAIERIDAQTAERAASAAVAQFSETMQRSLLTEPHAPDHLQIAVRYVPAASEGYVGGDWYDVFRTSDGATHLVIGDVAGHGRTAAAAMAQLRNMLRGIAYTSGGPPSAMLTALDQAAVGLDLDIFATVLVARVEQDTSGDRTLRWSTAGHPPPLLLSGDGQVRHLPGRPDLLIGADPQAPRRDQTHPLQPGDAVLMFTDGLVERRHADLDDGLAWLADAAGALAAAPPEQLCGALLEQVGAELEDDVALLVLKVNE